MHHRCVKRPGESAASSTPSSAISPGNPLPSARLVARRPGEKAAADDLTLDFTPPGGGRGYYRTPVLVSLWATAPYLHNNALGDYYVTLADGTKGWVSNDGTHWRKERTDPWQERKTVDVDYRIDNAGGRTILPADYRQRTSVLRKA